jgi:hypothetical protein
MTFSASVWGWKRSWKFAVDAKNKVPMQDICLRTSIAVFHLGAYFARMLSGEVQCANDDAAV